MSNNLESLIELAKEVRERAFAPYSGFKVGAAVISKDGEMFSGCNVESASFGLTVCAERVAIWKAVSEGVNDLIGITVVTDTDELTPPCGGCRQIIWEFCGDVPVTLANLKGDVETISIKELLPRAFDTKFLK